MRASPDRSTSRGSRTPTLPSSAQAAEVSEPPCKPNRASPLTQQHRQGACSHPVQGRRQATPEHGQNSFAGRMQSGPNVMQAPPSKARKQALRTRASDNGSRTFACDICMQVWRPFASSTVLSAWSGQAKLSTDGRQPDVGQARSDCVPAAGVVGALRLVEAGRCQGRGRGKGRRWAEGSTLGWLLAGIAPPGGALGAAEGARPGIRWRGH